MTTVLRFTQGARGACATQRDLDEGIGDRFPDDTFREVDIQADLETAESYGVRKTPTTLVYADGDRVAEFVGVVEWETLDAKIRDAEIRDAANRDAETARPGLAKRLVNLVRG